MSLWGASLKPSSKETSCAFIIQSLTTSLLESTGNITNKLRGDLTGALDSLNVFDNKNMKISNGKNGKKPDPGSALPPATKKDGNVKPSQVENVVDSTNNKKNVSDIKSKHQGNGLFGLGII